MYQINSFILNVSLLVINLLVLFHELLSGRMSTDNESAIIVPPVRSINRLAYTSSDYFVLFGDIAKQVLPGILILP